MGGVYEPRVQGFELVDGVYEQMPWEEGPDGFLAAWSPVMRLELRFADGQLRFWDRETAQYLELPEEEGKRLRLEAEGAAESEAAARREAEALRREAEERAERAEQALEEEKRARKALEGRIARSEAESRSARDPT